jgi:U3 small nucleolar RNA-associated protein 22
LECAYQTVVLFWKYLGATALPTPRYNSSVLEDMCLEDSTEFLKKTFLGWKALGEALVLLKVK